jgi:UMF1 family MFS transporter
MAIITQLTGDGRFGIVSLVIFFIVGIFMLRKVDIERGIKEAQAEDARMITVE